MRFWFKVFNEELVNLGFLDLNMISDILYMISE